MTDHELQGRLLDGIGEAGFVFQEKCRVLLVRSQQTISADTEPPRWTNG